MIITGKKYTSSILQTDLMSKVKELLPKNNYKTHILLCPQCRLCHLLMIMKREVKDTTMKEDMEGDTMEKNIIWVKRNNKNLFQKMEEEDTIENVG